MNISIAQALLLIIEHYQAYKNKIIDAVGVEAFENDYQALVFYYINGPQNPGEKNTMYQYLNNFQNTILASYHYPKIYENDDQAINNDATKRYFETHLALECIKRGVNHIDKDRLTRYKTLMQNLYRKDTADYFKKIEILDGKVPTSINVNDKENFLLFKEYADYISRIKSKEIFTEEQGFSQEQRDKILVIVQCSILAVLCAKSSIVNQLLPLNIYENDLFSTDQRGKILKTDEANKPLNQEETSSHHHGLIKSFMPIMLDDEAMSIKPYDYLKPSEQATYNRSSEWAKLSFYRSVHPFSNSISGTALCQLRVLAKFQEDENNLPSSFTENEKAFKDFFRIFSSILLFFSGGHSFMEFMFPLQLQSVVEAFVDRNNVDYLKLSNANLYDMFQPISSSKSDVSGNEDIKSGVEVALRKAISYNHVYLQKKKLNNEIINYSKRRLRHHDLMETDEASSKARGENSSSRQDAKKRKRDSKEDEKTVKRPRLNDNIGFYKKNKSTDKLEPAEKKNPDGVKKI